MNSVRTLLATVGLASLLAAGPLAASAQAPVTQNATATVTATIVAIDYTNRIATLQLPDGSTKTVKATAAVTRFPELKVGDKVTVTSTQSVVYSIAKPGATPPPDTTSMTAAAGAKPGGTATQMKTTIVTVTAIDPSVPAITVKTADGRITSFKVKDPKNLTGVKVGDKIQVTYNVSLAVSVK